MINMSLVKHSDRTLRTPCDGCGSKELYLAHDTSDTFGVNVCTKCTERARKEDPSALAVRGELVKVNVDITPHVCGETRKAQPVTASPKVESAPAVADPAAQMLAAIQAMMAAPRIDRAAVEDIAREIVSGLVFPTRTVVVRDGITREVPGATHERLADVTTMLLGGMHVMMVGPAGTGKSTIAHNAADALGLPYFSISLNPQLPTSQLLGYMQAAGEYVPMPFRQAYEHGGVFHFDEIDNCHPGVLATVNAALSNGTMAFPDGMVKRHADFLAVASANTYGHGATREYAARQAMDGATLDRFAVLTIEIDEALEYAMCMSTGIDQALVDRVIKYVRRLRATERGLPFNVILSPRATHGMCKALAVGVSWDAAVNACVRKGLDDSSWSQLGG